MYPSLAVTSYSCLLRSWTHPQGKWVQDCKPHLLCSSFHLPALACFCAALAKSCQSPSSKSQNRVDEPYMLVTNIICNHILRRDVQPEVSKGNDDHILQQWLRCTTLVLLAVIHFPELSVLFMMSQTSYQLMLFVMAQCPLVYKNSALSLSMEKAACSLSESVCIWQPGLCRIDGLASLSFQINLVAATEMIFGPFKNRRGSFQFHTVQWWTSVAKLHATSRHTHT